jgi:hypothetical protein
MPGPHDLSDQVAAGYERSHDQGRRPDLREGQPDRPARGSLTDLRQRLERLPGGHPSSPYHDDGTRKPAVVRLKDLELPVPSDVETTEAERPVTDRPDADRPDADRPDADSADADRPDVVRADADRADTDRPDVVRPDADRADADSAEPGLPETAKEAPGPPEAISPAASDQPRSGRDGSWEWKGRRLSADHCRIADQTLSRCRAAEGRTVFGTYGDAGLTPSMRRIEAQLENGQLVPDTEKFALKSPDRFKEKLAKLIQRNPDKSSVELATEIHDTVRYTYLFEAEHYVDGIWHCHSALEGQGYELEVRRNSWDNPEYKGINTRWHDPGHDVHFEVQFHTPASWDAKQRTHGAYERIADPRTSPHERVRLRSEQAELSATIPVPARCTEIANYRKEGL